MSHEINIKEVIEDKKSWFNIRRFKAGNINFERPEKTLDIKELTKHTFTNIVNIHKFKLFEASKSIKDFQIIRNIENEEEDSKINSFFYKKTWLENNNKLITFTFNFNPYNYIKKVEEISGFLNYYYYFSKPFLFVPNIRKNRIFSKPYKKETIIDLENYLKFVDSTYELFNAKNSKPIFVPVSLRMSATDIKLLANHYLKKEYYYYWFDFEGKAINETSLARIRNFINVIRDEGYYDKIITYFTNIKREIISNVKDPKSPASDVLASVAGANIIGVDREPQRKVEGPLPPPDHKARLLNRKSYYYEKTRDRRFRKKELNVSYNAVLLDKEFEAQTNHFLDHQEIEKFLERKEMLSKYREGTILRSLISKKPILQKTLKWF